MKQGGNTMLVKMYRKLFIEYDWKKTLPLILIVSLILSLINK